MNSQSANRVHLAAHLAGLLQCSPLCIQVLLSSWWFANCAEGDTRKPRSAGTPPNRPSGRSWSLEVPPVFGPPQSCPTTPMELPCCGGETRAPAEKRTRQEMFQQIKSSLITVSKQLAEKAERGKPKQTCSSRGRKAQLRSKNLKSHGTEEECQQQEEQQEESTSQIQTRSSKVWLLSSTQGVSMLGSLESTFPGGSPSRQDLASSQIPQILDLEFQTHGLSRPRDTLQQL